MVAATDAAGVEETCGQIGGRRTSTGEAERERGMQRATADAHRAIAVRRERTVLYSEHFPTSHWRSFYKKKKHIKNVKTAFLVHWRRAVLGLRVHASLQALTPTAGGWDQGCHRLVWFTKPERNST